MLNVLAGALVGGVFNVAAYVIVQKLKHEPITWQATTASFVGGVVGGAIAGSTFGMSLAASGGIRMLGFLSADGAVGSVAETVTENGLEGKRLTENVVHDAIVGAVEAPIFYGFTRGLAKALPVLDPILEGTDVVPSKPRPRLTTAGRAALHHVKHDAHHHAAFAVALANALQGWGGQLLEGVEGYGIPVPDFSPDATSEAPPATKGLAGALPK